MRGAPICDPCRQAGGAAGRRARVGETCARCGRQQRARRDPTKRSRDLRLGDIIILVHTQGVHPAGTKGGVFARWDTPEGHGVLVDLGPEAEPLRLDLDLDNWERVGRGWKPACDPQAPTLGVDEDDGPNSQPATEWPEGRPEERRT